MCLAINLYNGGSCTSNLQCNTAKNITCVGTVCTCADSLYWVGVRVKNGKILINFKTSRMVLFVSQKNFRI